VNIKESSMRFVSTHVCFGVSCCMESQAKSFHNTWKDTAHVQVGLMSEWRAAVGMVWVGGGVVWFQRAHIHGLGLCLHI